MENPPIGMQLENEIEIWNEYENGTEMKGDSTSHVKVKFHPPEMKML